MISSIRKCSHSQQVTRETALIRSGEWTCEYRLRFQGTKYEFYNHSSPLVKCSFLPTEFIECHPLLDHKGNKTAKDLVGHGCVKFGGSYHQDVEHTKALCEALPEIECFGERTFWRDGFPCVKHTDHYFVTTLIYSILLGFLGMDRFCLVRKSHITWSFWISNNP